MQSDHQTMWWCYKHYNLLLCETHHVVPEGTSHQRLCPLAEMEAIGTKEGAVRAAILNRKICQCCEQLGQFIDSVRKDLFFSVT